MGIADSDSARASVVPETIAAELSELEMALKNHDWYYPYSDDYSAWAAGDREARRIVGVRISLVRRGYEAEVRSLWSKYCPFELEAAR